MEGSIPDTMERRVARVDVYITAELDQRPGRPVDHGREKNALQDLAIRMAEDPEAVLPRFVQLAMELTGASTAGISIYEPEPRPGLFRWRDLHGELAAFEGTTTPRDHSPCGVTLDRNGPVLATHPERAYDWLAAAAVVLPEVLLVPLHVGREEPLGTLWVVGEERHFCNDDARILTELAAFVATALRMAKTEERLRQALLEQETLAREMSHRVKNVYALTESMIRLTATKVDSPAAMADSLTGRIRAMADAHSLTHRSAGALDGGETTDLAELVEAILKPHAPAEGKASCFSVDGPAIQCGPHAANGIALMLHEFATNAVKYGALSTQGGEVDVRWRRDGETLVLEWCERGGPRIDAAPAARGFGTTLVRRMITGQFAGTFDQDWPPEGLACTVSLALDRLHH